MSQVVPGQRTGGEVELQKLSRLFLSQAWKRSKRKIHNQDAALLENEGGISTANSILRTTSHRNEERNASGDAIARRKSLIGGGLKGCRSRGHHISSLVQTEFGS